ncbi:MAG: C25 family cysteine peptidase, partial [Candidatus Cloacimonetes bacterium]|nr:C25 family cysteine peptidase [Candidatus Cloacimonadota bacterium]
MNRSLTLIILLCLPLLLSAAQLTLSLDLSNLDPASPELPTGWGSLSAPGSPRLPVKTVNIVLPPQVEDLSFSHSFSGLNSIPAPAPPLNPPFANGERILFAPAASPGSAAVSFRGIGHWGEVAYASFSVLPAIHTGAGWEAWQELQISLDWTQPVESAVKALPSVWQQLAGKGFEPGDFFANPADLGKYYTPSSAKNYDYLIVSTPELYTAVAQLESYRQGQGLITAFADIATILTSSPGASDGEKLRNYLISQYYSHPFDYLLLVGDHNTVPVMYLTPEPDGYETVASDFFYSDLSSIVDADSDGRLGEYSSGDGIQDFLCDFTPEVFVGRISTNNPGYVSLIAARTVAYEQSQAPWKQKALLPAAYLNYGGEPEPVYLQTDGATFMEIARQTILSDYDCTTMYEQTGFLPSYPSDIALDYNLLKNELSTNSYGILSWSAHGSSGSSSRKVWMNDDNGNNLPDSWEMDWMGMVDRQSFDNLANPDGMVIFAGSCYNGMIDSNQQCLAEYALQNKAVAVSAATRTGWYKIGWTTPGWGGVVSYNYHWLENITNNAMTVGAAQAFANLTHTQYYLFGDPVDAGGIIYPELQNVYTYLLYGDPALGHIGQPNYTNGEILVYEPFHQDGLPIVEALDLAHFNVVYTDKLIPDYYYINQFEAVFCLFGWGDTAYILDPDSLDYALLNSYLEGGGKLYLEGDVAWDPQDPFWGKFATHAPLDYFAYIEDLTTTQLGHNYTWGYDDLADPHTQILVPYTSDTEVLFTTFNLQHPDHTVAILHDTNTFATIASSFALVDVDDTPPYSSSFRFMLGTILDRLGVIDYLPTDANDPQTPAPTLSARVFPNPFAAGMALRVELPKTSAASLEIYNLRGQKIHTLSYLSLPAGAHELLWDGRDALGEAVASGLYFWRFSAGKDSLSG